MVEIAWPWLLLFLPLPVATYWLLPQLESTSAALKVPFLARFSALGGVSQTQSHPLFKVLMLALWLLLILAVIRPQWVGDAVELPVTGRDLMLAVDISGSMQTEDFQVGNRVVDRLTATKWVAGDFIERRVGDRVGLILFGSNAYVQTPLTFDRKTVRMLLDESAIGLAGVETAIGDAIGLMVKRLEGARKKGDKINPVLILLTDGANTAGAVAPLKAAELAAARGLKIYTIGIGADEMLVQSLFGTRKVNPSRDLDEKSLKQIAESTGGLYFRARDTEEFQAIYALIDEMEPVARESLQYRPVAELYQWPLGAAFILGTMMLLWRFWWGRS
ncbi:MAG: VWA domain-containing protein [Chromatiales bacterium]|nr:VWA domain-containing protein [Chromatiales bacterium]